jgi:hypothetical protein
MGDALDRIRKKQRPKVQPRSTQVDQKSEDIQISRHTQSDLVEKSRHIDDPTYRHIEADKKTDSRHIDANMSELLEGGKPLVSEDSRHIDVSTYRHTDLNMSDIPEEVEVKRSTFRLEAELINRLHRLCKDAGISREVFIEAMFEHIETHPPTLNQVLVDAAMKHEHRLQLANRKRAASMVKKFGN